MSPRDSLTRINALAIPAAILFAAGAATVLVLDRIGVPDGLVRAIAPILTLLGLATVGLGVRNADIASFLAARRSALPFYGGLGLAAIAAGMALCIYPNLALSADPPPLGMAAGLALGAVGFAPLIRRFGATSANDLIATRFARSPAAVISGIAAWAAAAATTLRRVPARGRRHESFPGDEPALGRDPRLDGGCPERDPRRTGRRDRLLGRGRRSSSPWWWPWVGPRHGARPAPRSVRRRD